MTFTLRVRVEAEEDLLQACEWYASRKTGLGERLLDATDVLLQRIVAHPTQWAEGYRGVRRAKSHVFLSLFIILSKTLSWR